MEKKRIPIDWISIAILAAMFVLTTVVWSSTPERIAVHWSLWGEADGWADRVVGLLLLPLIATVLEGIHLLITKIIMIKDSPTVRNASQSIVRSLLALLAVLHLALVLSALGGEIGVARVAVTGTGFLLMAVGRKFYDLPPNRWIGIRTRATLRNEIVWNKTHQIGMWVFFGLGLIVLFAALLPLLIQALLLIVGLLGSMIVLVGYSARVEAMQNPEASEDS